VSSSTARQVLAISTPPFQSFLFLSKQEALHGEIRSVEDAIARTRARIVQSPERIKKTISIMSTTAIEDKKTVTMHEAKARDLQAKINALLNIEKVRINASSSYFLNGCLIRMFGDASNKFKLSKEKSNHLNCLRRHLGNCEICEMRRSLNEMN
jgi:hypothetical protein